MKILTWPFPNTEFSKQAIGVSIYAFDGMDELERTDTLNDQKKAWYADGGDKKRARVGSTMRTFSLMGWEKNKGQTVGYGAIGPHSLKNRSLTHVFFGSIIRFASIKSLREIANVTERSVHERVRKSEKEREIWVWEKDGDLQNRRSDMSQIVWRED